MTTPAIGTLPTWDEAVANAKVSRRQGVGVWIDEGQKWIGHYRNGKLVSTESFPPPTGEA